MKLTRVQELTPYIQKYKPALIFLGKLAVIYTFWKVFIALVGYNYTDPNTTPLPWLTTSWHFATEAVRQNIISFLEISLNFLGYQPIIDDNVVRTPGIGGILIANYCLAFQIWFLFAALILVFPAHFINKLWYIPLGLLIIHIANLIRHLLALLSLIHIPQSSEYFAYQHIISRGIFFLLVLGLYLYFIKKFAKRT